ncbi:class I SAM-dependent methyltransferase [Aggregatilinea lenta]|uniref:class I SAM-dependent methyltransferase n=1 Tax=Aggregatilinea lenta TaxID=913108 RepID=UPI000E5B22AE|nr:class I SAM-dependent methyltransferase [Aggregatilinea lenta]
MHTESDATPSPRRPSWHERLFASLIASESTGRSHYYEARKRALLGDLHGDVLEIGPGTGANLTYYPADVRWLGIDPNPAMFPYVQREAQRLGLSIQLREGQAEHLDVPDSSLDAVVSTQVLCSVTNPQRSLREIVRVLKPGGRFVFIEHVAAPRGSGRRRWQRIVRPLWQVMSDACHVDRETGAAIEHAGFSSVHLDHFHLDIPIVGPHIAGFAIK